ncbi:hypothetical protein [Aliamphritea hakodatensis]|uniref:hypothetical protein n=1 Tax=Aliamphritea hakodatensis TaxID=2895352 RepID=UPI0022FD7160|nr:hypothetical protein [Aliamphritea hakodatensis]
MANHQIDNVVYSLRSCFNDPQDTTPLTTLDARINLRRLYDYRVLDIGTMGMFGSAQGELIHMLNDWEKGVDPTPEDLRNLMWRYASVLRCIDFADRFMLVHSEPLEPNEEIEALRKRLSSQLHNRTQVVM